MKCDICHINEASIMIQGDVPGMGHKELHICQQCASKQGADVMSGIVKGLGLTGIFQTLVDNLGDTLAMDVADDEIESRDDGVKTPCACCGMTLGELKKTGKTGCPECYENFSEIIMEALENMHKGRVHIPRESQRGAIGPEVGNVVDLTLKISRKQKELENVIKLEYFEDAALLRDEISILKAELDECIGEQGSCE